MDRPTTPRSASLCSHCQYLFDPSLVVGEDLERVVINRYLREDVLPGLDTLIAAAENGCALCAELKTRVLQQKWSSSTDHLHIGPATLVFEGYYFELSSEEDGPFSLEISLTLANTEDPENCTLCFDLFAKPGSYGAETLHLRRQPPFSERTSPECISTIHSWLSECSGFHWQCTSASEAFHPTRLIDVGPPDGSVNPTLVMKPGGVSKYVALSHCWGKPGPGIRMSKTISSTIEPHQQGIPMQSMPQNFQGAVIITRALGLRYVWIDSLCIIQDSTEDWGREGSQMDKVYKCAWITLAATTGATSEDGFLAYPLKDRTLEVQLLPRVDSGMDTALPQPQSGQNSIFIRYMETQDNSRFERDVELTTWDSRGWTLQERHLATRIIHFSRSQIFFECRKGYESECGQKIGIMPQTFDPIHGPALLEPSSDEDEQAHSEARSTISSDGFDMDTISDEDNRLARSRLYNWWFQVLADYSSRQLTYPSDKLLAISGLASQLTVTGRHLGITGRDETYLCGLWVSFLADCLLWIPEQTSDMVKADIYRAPTWSWAAWDGTVIPAGNYEWDQLPSESCIEYLDHTLELQTESIYGGVKSASLALRGKLRRIKLTRSTENMISTGRFTCIFRTIQREQASLHWIAPSTKRVGSTWRISLLYQSYDKSQD